jgi:hypothetical protein
MHGQLQFVPLELHPGSIFGVAGEDIPTQPICLEYHPTHSLNESFFK